MFCINCGKQVTNNLKFCSNCGTPVNEEIVNVEQEKQLEQPKFEKPKQTAKEFSKAIAAVLIVLIVTSMLMGWITISIDTWSMTGEVFAEFLYADDLWEVRRVVGGVGEIHQTTSINDLPNFVSVLNIFVDVVEREGVRWGMSQADISNFRSQTEPIRTFSSIVDVIRIVFAACILFLVLFLFLMTANIKIAKYAGLVATLFVFLLSAVFLIATFVGNSIIADNLGDYIQISASLWVYVTLGLSSLAFLFLLMRKGIFL